MPFVKRRQDKSPEDGVVVCRGDELNLWKVPEEADEDVLSDSEAQIEGLKMTPGTLTNSEVDSFLQEVSSKLKVDVDEVASSKINMSENNIISLRDYLYYKTASYPEDHPKRKKPFRVWRWTD